MNNWWFALVVFGFGLLFTIFMDRRKEKPGSEQSRRQRKRWIDHWFLGIDPSRDRKDDKDKPK